MIGFYFDYYCLNCKKLMETSSAPVISGTFICGFCGAIMVLNAAKGTALAQPDLAHNRVPPNRTQISDNLADTVLDRTLPPHSEPDHISGLDGQ